MDVIRDTVRNAKSRRNGNTQGPYGILNNIWDIKQAPGQWKVGLLVKLPKKGDLADSNNWRGIMPLSITCKVPCRVILKTESPIIDPLLTNEQVGFTKGKSCADQIFTLRQIM